MMTSVKTNNMDARQWQLEHNIFVNWRDAGFLALTRRDKQCVVVANGCFDLLHAGHVSMLEAARKLPYAFTCGNPAFVIAAVNCDEVVSKLKGPGRPVVPFLQRLYALASLKWVDCVVGFTEDDPVPLLQAIRPHVLVKGSEYAEDVIGSTYAVVFRPPMLPDISTTRTVSRIAYVEAS